MKNIAYFATFAIGAAAGAAASWLVVKNKYERIANEEIESVKNTFMDLNAEQPDEGEEERVESEDIPESEEQVDYSPDAKEIRDYCSYVKGTGYKSYNSDVVHEKPFVISVEEFGELDDYECIQLTLYADKVLADDMNEVVDDIQGTIGSLEHFEKYEDDVVYYRNDRLKCDYEVVFDERDYIDTSQVGPRNVEV